jgi:phage terminase large subunit-like protein
MALDRLSKRIVRDLYMPGIAARFHDELMQRKRLTSAPRDIWDFIANDERYPNFSRHLQVYVDVLMKSLDEEVRICLAAPPQHGKTTVTLFGLAYFCTLRTGLYHVFITYNDAIAKQQAKLFCAILREQGIKFKKTGNIVSVEKGAENGGNTVRFMALHQGLSGYPINGVVVVDDALKGYAQANSLSVRNGIYELVLTELFARKSKGKLSIIVMATRWHDDDLTGRLVRFHDWPYLRIPAICDGQDDPAGREVGEPLWSAGQSLESLEVERLNQGERRFSALWQGIPMPDGGFAFMQPQTYQERPKEGRWLVSYGIDPAGGKNKRSDWSVMVRLISDTDNKVSYVDRVWRMQCKMLDFLPYMQQAQDEMPGTITWYYGGQEASIAQFMEHVSAKQGGLKINLLPAAAGSKYVRATEAIDAWNNGRILVPMEPNQQMKQFIGVVTSFTGQNDGIDDDVDALAGAFQPLIKRVPRYTGLPRDVAERLDDMYRRRHRF